MKSTHRNRAFVAKSTWGSLAEALAEDDGPAQYECAECGQTCSVTEFLCFPKTGEVGNRCAECRAKSTRMPQALKQRIHRSDPVLGEIRRRGTHLKSLGLSPYDFLAMKEEQGGACAICGRRQTGKRSLALDHDHNTGIVRALLCSNCNTGLGMMGDDPARLRAAADYLEYHRQKAAL